VSILRRLALLLLPAIAAGQTLATSASSAAPTPAEWKSYDVLVELRTLPRTYSCDELWYKVRDVLLQLGARAYMTITPFDCGSRRGEEARSPSVEVKFQLPEPLRGAATRYADTSVSEQAVRLAPGAPSSLQAGDCELMRQMEETLLAGLPVHITASAFDCGAAAKSFTVTLDAPLVARAGEAPQS
jgi:hypothetical protein